ncbi:hypothetical protein EST38_g9536 [Candolleomyces aberdarensis]|uniref:DUF6533 domain-containing protein n=1 Tax=Candolleomyces aberdarensis TaxID=2316362 RepID=A0A4Q2DBU7_9AGAR|nr:hypothetical protein EST38_g9536 [Candolleomyces aberdarensis]
MDASPATIIRELEYFQVTKYCSVVALTVLVYDIILTMDKEVSTVWGSRWTFGKCLYLLNCWHGIFLSRRTINQYDQEIQAHLSSRCRSLQLSATITGIAVVTMIEGILIIRTYALYPSRLLLTSLILLALLSLGTMLGCFLTIYQKEIFIPNMFGISGCLQFCVGPLCHSLLVAFWLPFFLLETIVFILTAWKTFADYVDMNGALPCQFPRSARAAADSIVIIRLDKTFVRKPTGLIEVITRDGFVYYLGQSHDSRLTRGDAHSVAYSLFGTTVILAMSAANMLIWLFAPFSLAYMGIALLKSIQVIMCSRCEQLSTVRYE